MEVKTLSLLAIFLFCLTITGFTSATGTPGDSVTNSSVQSVNANITAITPLSGKLGETVAFNVTGTNFDKSAEVYLERRFTRDTKTIEGKNVQVNSDTDINGTFRIPGDYTPGEWDVIVEQNDQKSRLRSQFTINR